MTIPVSNIVSINIEPDPAITSSLTNFALSNIVGTSNRINPEDRVIEFSNLREVGEVFCVTDPEYQAAAIYFAQQPTPQSVLISRQFTTDAPWDLVFTSVTLDDWGFADDTVASLVFVTNKIFPADVGTAVSLLSIDRSFPALYSNWYITYNSDQWVLIDISDPENSYTIFSDTTYSYVSGCIDAFASGDLLDRISILTRVVDRNTGVENSASFVISYSGIFTGNARIGSTTVLANSDIHLTRFGPGVVSGRIWGVDTTQSQAGGYYALGYYAGSSFTSLSEYIEPLGIAFNSLEDTIYVAQSTIIKKKNIYDNAASWTTLPLYLGTGRINTIQELFVRTGQHFILIGTSEQYTSRIVTIDITGDNYREVNRTTADYNPTFTTDTTSLTRVSYSKIAVSLNRSYDAGLKDYYEVIYNDRPSGLAFKSTLTTNLALNFSVAQSSTQNYDLLAKEINKQTSGTKGVIVNDLTVSSQSLGFSYNPYGILLSYNHYLTDSNTQIAIGGAINKLPPYITVFTDIESPSQAMNAIADIRNDWYAFTYVVTDKGDSATQSANLELATWALTQNGSDNPHLFLFNTMDSNAINPSVTTDIFSKNKATNNKKSAGVYDPNNKFSAVPIMSMLSTIDWQSGNVPTFAYKKAFNITPNSVLTQSQLNTLLAKFGGAYVQYGSLFSGYTKTFKTGSGDYVDAVAALDVLTTLLKINIATQLASTSKIQYTDSGVSQLSYAINQVLNLFVANGFLSAGVWNGESFGELQTGQFVNDGYYVYIPPASSASQKQRNSRQYPPFRIALLGSGAIEQIVINGTFQN